MDIRRGDIFFVEKTFGNRGFENEAGRPAVIVSNDKCNMFSGVVEVVFLTSRQKKDMPTHVEIICQNKSTALCEQIHSVSVDRLGQWYKTCTDEEMKSIDEALLVSLGLTNIQTEHKSTQSGSDVHDDEVKRLTIERDMFKKLYDQMLEKLIG